MDETDVRSSRRERASAELRDMWETRPARPRDDRKIAGVAAAIGRRYDVDPVLVRIAFVVAAFYGPGIPLYLAGCVVLPDARSAPGGRGRGAAAVATVLVGVAAVVSAILLLGGDGGWLLPMLASLGLLVALHVTRGDRGLPGSTDAPPPGPRPDDDPTVAVPWESAPADAGAGTPGAGAADAPTVAADGTTDPPATTEGSPGEQPRDGSQVPAQAAATPPPATSQSVTPPPAPPAPPSWDPLGAAPFAWDLPEPRPLPEPPAPPPSRLTPVTLAVALVAAGIAGVLALTAPGSLGVAAVPATALAVVGIGLVIGAFRHAGRWLIPFAVLLAAVTWLAAVVPWPDLRDGVGQVAATPLTARDLAPEYRRGVGDISLDLRRLDLAGATGPVHTTAEVGVGSIQVVVPPTADVVVRAEAGLGDVTVAGRSSSGDSAALSLTDPGPDGPGGRPIELDLRAGTGSVEVSRG